RDGSGAGRERAGGNAKVENLDQGPVVGQEKVGRLDVAVNKAVLEGVLQAKAGLADVVASAADRQRPLLLDHAGQVDALDKLQDQKMRILLAESPVDLQQIRM